MVAQCYNADQAELSYVNVTTLMYAGTSLSFGGKALDPTSRRLETFCICLQCDNL